MIRGVEDKVTLYAFNSATNEAADGSSPVSAFLVKDGVSTPATNDPVFVENGIWSLLLTETETDTDWVTIGGISEDPDVTVIPKDIDFDDAASIYTPLAGDAYAISYVTRNAATAVDPTLTESEILGILQDCRIVDSEERIITDADYETTYDLTRAVVTAWETKAAKASGSYSFSESGLTLNRQQIIDNCLKMVKIWNGKSVQTCRMSPESDQGQYRYTDPLRAADYIPDIHTLPEII